MKSTLLSQQLLDLTTKASELFNDLVFKAEYNFLKEVSENKSLSNSELIEELKENWELDSLPIIDVVNEITGEHHTSYVCLVSHKTITVIDMDSDDVKNVEFEDLASLEDKLIVLNEMEELLK